MNLRIFLSSTFLDLSGIRTRIREHLSVIPSEIVTMELFGSDEEKPVEFSLVQLRTCNLFIGIYAERYGTVDINTGKSLTELEYWEARKLLEMGQLNGLLIYMLHPKAKWPIDLVDRDANHISLLNRLKEEIKSHHTITYFDDPEKLSLGILRDVLRKTGIDTSTALKPRIPSIPQTYKDARVIGMEYYTERDASHFHGREDAVATLTKLIEEHPVTLLIGDSGVGKTSLQHAGLLPSLKRKGWAVAITRPLEDADTRITDGLWSQLMESPLRPRTTLNTALGLVSMAHSDRFVLLAIDQFEDAIPALGQDSTADLLSTLARAHSTPLPNVKLLISYRGDTDPKVGPYWQQISGSVTGLPRYYLQPLSTFATKRVLSELLAPQADPAELDSLTSHLIQDLAEESSTIGIVDIYPPFLQMLVETLLKQAELGPIRLSEELYHQLNGSHEIIGRYLINQLRFLGDQQAEARRVLPELVSKTGRLRKSAEDLSRDTGLTTGIVEDLLHRLSNLRIVRFHNDVWEIVHDFLARRIWEEFSNPEEQDARIFRELLTAKSAIFPNTKELLTAGELLGLYAHRKRIRCSSEDIKLIFLSALKWSAPCRYYERQVTLDLSMPWALDNTRSEDVRISQNAFRFALANGYKPRLAELAEEFSDFRLQAELANFIALYAQPADFRLLLFLRNRRKELVAQAARAALLRLAKPSNHKVLSILLRSGKHEDLVLAFQILSQGLVTRKKQGGRGARRSIVERVTTICQVGHAQVIADAAVDLGTALRSASKSEAAAAAFSYVVGTRDPSQRNTVLARLLKSRTNAIRRGALAAVETFGRRVDIKVILSAYERFPNETAKSILACVQPGDFSLLCQFVQSRQLEPAIRDILIALARAGGNKGVKFIIRLIQNSSERVNVWNVPLLAQSLGECANRSLIPNLKAFMTSLEFWRHIGRSEKTEKHLPVRDSSNVHIFRRVVGTCLAMICSEPEWDILRRLVLHQYSTIRIAAARSIARFATVDHLDSLLSDFRRSTDYEDLDAVRVIDEAIYGKATLAKEFLMSSGLQTTSVTEASRPS